MFESCTKLTSVNFSNFDTSKVEDMSSLFKSCYEISEITMKMFKMFEEKYKLQNKHNLYNLFSITKEDLGTSVIRIVCDIYKSKEGDILNNLKQNSRENNN